MIRFSGLSLMYIEIKEKCKQVKTLSNGRFKIVHTLVGEANFIKVLMFVWLFQVKFNIFIEKKIFFFPE